MPMRPTPSALRQLSGSNLHRLNPKEPRTFCYRKVESVPCPKAVAKEPEAKAEWDETIPDLVTNGLLNRGNLKMWAAYCLAYAAAEHAQDDVLENGRVWQEPIVKVNKRTGEGEIVGYKRQLNPNIAQAQKHRLEMLRHAIEFGATPASATRIMANPDVEQRDSFADFADPESEDEDKKPC